MNSMVMAHRHRRSSAIGRRSLELVFAALAAVATLVCAAPAHAEDRVAALDRMLGSSSEKTRLSAVLALAKLGEPRVEKPLIRALRDPSAKVRGVAAAALGQLECEAAQSSLRLIARNDDDPDVRKAATAAAMKITSNRARARAAGEAEVEARRQPPGGERPSHAGFTAEPHPELYVLINSANDDSPGTTDPATRKLHGDLLKRALLDRLRSDASITSQPADAQRWALQSRHLDVSVTRLAAVRAGELVEVDAQLRIAISDDSGKMLSLLSGGAKVQVPAGKFDTRYLPALRKEALDNALLGISGKLLAQLRESP